MAKLLNIYLNDTETSILSNFVQEQNAELFPAKLSISTFFKNVGFKYIENYYKQKHGRR